MQKRLLSRHPETKPPPELNILEETRLQRQFLLLMFDVIRPATTSSGSCTWVYVLVGGVGEGRRSHSASPLVKNDCDCGESEPTAAAVHRRGTSCKHED